MNENLIFIEIPNPVVDLLGLKNRTETKLSFKIDLNDNTPNSCMTQPKGYFEEYSHSYVNSSGVPPKTIKLNYEQVKKLMISFNLLGRVGSVLKDFLLAEGLLTEENYVFKTRENYFNLGDLTAALASKEREDQNQHLIKSLYYSKSKTRKNSEEFYFKCYDY